MSKTLRRITFPRLWRSVMYFSLSLAGVMSFFFPAPTVVKMTGGFTYLWSALLVYGGTYAGIATVRFRWTGEYAGVPALILSILVYAVCLMLNAHGGFYYRFSIGIIYFAFCAGLLSRWGEVREVMRSRVYEASHGQEED